MPQVSYRGIPEHGLALVTPTDPGYEALVTDILKRPQPFPAWPVDDTTDAAVLLNESGKAIVGLSYFWRYHKPAGPPVLHQSSNLGSSLQVDVITGRAPVGRDLGTFILPGSKRLISRQGMFGNNMDVLPDLPRRGGFAGSRSHSRPLDTDVTGIDLWLDLAILEDGLCVGPDEHDLTGQLRKSLSDQATLSATIVNRLRGGATPGQIFDLIRPLARGADRGPHGQHHLIAMFVSAAIQRLAHQTEEELLAWFEQEASRSADRLQRP